MAASHPPRAVASPSSAAGGKPRPAQPGGKPERARRRQADGTSATAARTAPAARRGAGGATTCPTVERPPRTEDQAQYDGPPIPDDITGKELDRSVLAQLKSLPEKLAPRVARHLVAAGPLMDTDPETAYQHTLAARARAARVAVVREARARRPTPPASSRRR